MSPTNTPLEKQLFQAVSAGYSADVRQLFTEHPELRDAYDHGNFGATPLTAACFAGQLAMVALLLDLGVDPNRRSDWHMGPWSPLHCAIHRRNTDIVDLLLTRGATPDAHTFAGQGLLDKLAELLDEQPAHVSELGGDGCQPLHFADTPEVADLLLERGANIDARCIDHYSTPAQYLCVAKPEVARYLFSKGATPDIFSASAAGACDVIEHLLAESPSLVNARLDQTFFPPGPQHDVHNILTFTVGEGTTPLHAAARGNSARGVKILIAHGCEINATGGYDDATALHVAAWHDCLEGAQALAAGGADINARSGKLHNNTPAGWAIVSGAHRVFDYLMDIGAEVLPWFIDDAKDGTNGRFDGFNCVPKENRARILARLLTSPIHHPIA